MDGILAIEDNEVMRTVKDIAADQESVNTMEMYRILVEDFSANMTQLYKYLPHICDQNIH